MRGRHSCPGFGPSWTSTAFLSYSRALRGSRLEAESETQRVELGVSARYVSRHGWVVTAITGFLSAYFMEDPRFRVGRHYHESETGIHVWVCELDSGMTIQKVIRRLQVDIPPCHVHTHRRPPEGLVRHVVDLPVETLQASSG